MRDTLSVMAGWRLTRGNYTFPNEQRLFDMYVRATAQWQPKSSKEYVPAVDA